MSPENIKEIERIQEQTRNEKVVETIKLSIERNGQTFSSEFQVTDAFLKNTGGLTKGLIKLSKQKVENLVFQATK